MLVFPRPRSCGGGRWCKPIETLADSNLSDSGATLGAPWRAPTSCGAGGSWEVRYRLGGRESRIRYGGKFRTLRDARARRDWIAGELAAQRVPDLDALAAADRAPAAETVRVAAEAWRASRLDVAAGTDATYAVALGRILPALGSLELDRLDTRRVAALVAELHDGRARA